jgi:fatty acid desaturase
MMAAQPDNERQTERALLLTLLALFLFASPFTLWWAAAGSPWFLPYLLWLLIILAGAWLGLWQRRHDL